MDSIGYFCFFIIVVCIVVLWVLLVKYNKRHPETESTDKPKTEIRAIPEKKDTEKPEKLASNQITIYEYNDNGQKWICPDCDGENRTQDKQCIICGYRI